MRITLKRPIAFLLLALVAGGASAHGVLQTASPAADSTLTSAPAELRLRFNEALEPTFSTLELSAASGAALAVDAATVDAADPRIIAARLPPLKPGSYTVHWSVMTRDGHRTHGDYGFTLK